MNVRSLITGLTLLTILANGGYASENNSLSETEQLQPQIIHVPVTSLRENEKLVVEARVDGAPRVVFMRLYFKSQGQQSFDYIDMTETGAGYFAELSPTQFSPPQLQYFILALLSDQKVITSPRLNPYGNPYVVNVASAGPATRKPPMAEPPVPTPMPETEPPQTTGREDTTTAGETFETREGGGEETPVLILSPEENAEFSVGEEVLIAVSFASENPIDISSINLLIDGRNVALDAEITENLLTYSSTKLGPGKHQVLVQGYYSSGVELPSTLWSFVVKGKARKTTTASSFNGRVFAETRQENISKTKFSDNNIGGNVYGKYGIAKYDARIFLTSRESSRFQPRHRYTFSVDLPLVGVTLGDTYPRFNDLMLWGKRVRGIHGRVRLGFFNLDVVTGQTFRAVKAERDLVLNPVTGDTLKNVANQDSTIIARFGTHKQNLFGIRPSFGSGKHFQLGFNFLKVRDDTSSLGPGEYSIPPQDNLVVGSDILFAFDNHRFEFRAAGAFSLLSNDISGGPLSKTAIEDQFDVSLPFDPADFDKWLIINASTTPLDPRDLTSLAYDFHFRFNYFNNDLQLGYKSIGSQYTSLGNSYLRNNIRGFYFQDRVRMYQNRIYLNFGMENYLDNFDADNQNPSTRLMTFNGGFSIFPGQGLPNLTFDLRTHNRNNHIDSLIVNPGRADSTAENNLTRDLTVQLNYDTNLMNLSHSISLSYVASNFNDRFSSDRLKLTGVNANETSSNVQVFSVRTQYQIPLVTTINFARNDNSFGQFIPGGANNFNFKMFGVKAEYYFFNRKLQTYFGTNFTTASGITTIDTTQQTVTDYSRTGFNFGARYEFAPGHFILMDSHIISFNDDGGTRNTTTGMFTSTNPSFTDRIFRLYYEKRF